MIVDGHGCHTALNFSVKAKENQDKVSTLYLLPKLYKISIKQDLLLKKHVFKYCEKVYERYCKTYFGLLQFR